MHEQSMNQFKSPRPRDKLGHCILAGRATSSWWKWLPSHYTVISELDPNALPRGPGASIPPRLPIDFLVCRAQSLRRKAGESGIAWLRLLLQNNSWIPENLTLPWKPRRILDSCKMQYLVVVPDTWDV